MEKQTFAEWHAKLTSLAKKHKIGWLIPPLKDYPRDGYDDDQTPAEELSEQFSAAAGCK